MYKTVKPTTFTLSLELLEVLDYMSKELGKKKTAIVSEALEMYMDYQDIQLAKKRLNDESENIKADVLITMGKSHKDFLIVNTTDTQILMLKEFAGYGEIDVRDPYGGSYYDYLDVRDEILDSIEKIADKIIELKKKKIGGL